MFKSFVYACGLSALLIGAVSAQVADSVDLQKAQEYCTQTSGEVYWRRATYGTNGPPTDQLKLANVRPFCQYTSASDGSRINVSLDTLVTEQPTLAALAYYAEVPLGTGCQGNPASCYCALLGGSDLFGGINAAGGGWVNNNTVDQTLEACVFPDLSIIDSWGLAYHSQNIIRGIDLAKVLRYQGPPTK